MWREHATIYKLLKVIWKPLFILLYNSLGTQLSVAQVTHSYSCLFPALGLNLLFLVFFSHSSQNLKNQAKNIPVVLPSSPIKIWGKSVQWFLSYDRSYKQQTTNNKQMLLLFNKIPAWIILNKISLESEGKAFKWPWNSFHIF